MEMGREADVDQIDVRVSKNALKIRLYVNVLAVAKDLLRPLLVQIAQCFDAKTVRQLPIGCEVFATNARSDYRDRQHSGILP